MQKNDIPLFDLANIENDIDIGTKKIVFVHIPKTGGRSIRTYMNNTGYVYEANEHKMFLKDTTNMDSKFVVTVVRNPYERYVSAVNYMLSTIAGNEVLFRGIFKALNTPLDLDVIKYFNEEMWRIMVIFKPQSDYFYSIKYDRVYKFEDSIDKIIKNINTISNKQSQHRIPKVNVSTKVFNSDMLSDAQKDLIYEIYKKDFELFGYQK